MIQPNSRKQSAITVQGPLEEARFHPNVKLYLFLQGLGILTASVIGIVLLPIWIVGGWWWAHRYYETLECVLGKRSLVVKRGVQFRTEKTIPLDQIQDVSVRHGPLLNWFGLTKLVVETAGQGSAQGAAASLTGIVGAVEFRDRVLEQRDALQEGSIAAPTSGASPVTGAPTSDLVALLREIRDVLTRIESSLRKG